jgi:hypothetical protein
VKPFVRRLLVYFLPSACNLALIGYLVWQMRYASFYDRHSEFLMFSALYAVGGAVMVVSAVTAFFHGSTPAKTARWYYALALVNTIIPTVLLLVLLKFR